MTLANQAGKLNRWS